MTASGVDDYFGEAVKECTGHGTWTFDAGRNTWSQKVEVDVRDCAGGPWNVGGTEGRVTLYQYIGDPDAWDLYTLRKTQDVPRP